MAVKCVGLADEGVVGATAFLAVPLQRFHPLRAQKATMGTMGCVRRLPGFRLPMVPFGAWGHVWGFRMVGVCWEVGGMADVSQQWRSPCEFLQLSDGP